MRDLSTREKRIARAAHIYQCFDFSRAEEILIGEGIDDTERAEGRKRGETERRLRNERWAQLGHPSFGGGHW